MRSMTGYGTGASQQQGFRAAAEIRSGNGRFSEIRMKVPADLGPWEAELRSRVASRIQRGRVDVLLALSSEEQPPVQVRLNTALAGRYLEAAEQLRTEFGLEGLLGPAELLSVPGMVEVRKPEESTLPEALLRAAIEALEAALAEHDSSRRLEGERIARDLRARLEEIARLRTEIAALVPEAVTSARDKLLERIRKLAPDSPLDPGRLEQETALLADRLDVTEELVRLEAHIEAGGELLSAAGEPVGKRLEFLLQEIGRETNTICAKSSEMEITRRALAIKAEIEKLREQVQNIE